MRSHLLLIAFMLFAASSGAQDVQVSSLPKGKYETVLKSNQVKWEKGDIILIDENTYRISSSTEVGEYKFSVSAQRIFFTSGPLKTIFAKTSMTNNIPAIVLPVNENQQGGIKLPSDIWGYHKQ